MPFLDHLEELRWRILWALAALLLGTVAGFFLVQEYEILVLLKEPIAPYLPDGKLIIIRPADAFIITLKLALVIGAVLASPVIFVQLWKFLSPALYAHEKRYIVPALLAGLGLFLSGVLMAYLWVLPAVFRILYGFQFGFLEWMITADAYFGFATRLILAFGIMFQLPLVMVLLSTLDLVRPRTFQKHRPLALVFAAVLAALLTPPDVFSMMMMMAPILILYEAGILISKLLGRRRRSTIGGAVVVFGLLSLWPGSAEAQLERPEGARRDTVGAQQDSLSQPLDTAAARRLGLPTAPSRSFPSPDSIMRALQARTGFHATRYAGDSITLFGETQEIVLDGRSLVEREGATLEAENIRFRESECQMLAAGDPKLFDQGTVLVGVGMRYDTCERIGTVQGALTRFNQSGVDWYLRGGLEIDSGSTRLYGASNDITSCDVPAPHYHFAAGEVKWVSNTVMVARPAVLYVRDVPVLWLPFIFQDMRPGRRSGLLVPRFGLSDLIRPSEGFQRNITNIGFYWAASDYFDVQFSLDWFSGNYTGLNGQMRYRWLNRFMTGSLGVSRIWEEGVGDSLPGDRSLRLQWTHNQNFNQRTRLTANVDFATKTDVVERNTVDPFVQTATLASSINFNKQYSWGTFTVGALRRQDLANKTTTQSLPTVTLTPSPINLSRNVTWSPSVSFRNDQIFDQGEVIVPLPPVNGVPRADTIRPDQRTTRFSLGTPLRIGRWNLQNSLSAESFYSTAPLRLIIIDDENPLDTIRRNFGEQFRTGVDWNTGVNLPLLFPSSWRLLRGAGQAVFDERGTDPHDLRVLSRRGSVLEGAACRVADLQLAVRSLGRDPGGLLQRHRSHGAHQPHECRGAQYKPGAVPDVRGQAQAARRRHDGHRAGPQGEAAELADLAHVVRLRAGGPGGTHGLGHPDAHQHLHQRAAARLLAHAHARPVEGRGRVRQHAVRPLHALDVHALQHLGQHDPRPAVAADARKRAGAARAGGAAGSVVGRSAQSTRQSAGSIHAAGPELLHHAHQHPAPRRLPRLDHLRPAAHPDPGDARERSDRHAQQPGARLLGAVLPHRALGSQLDHAVQLHRGPLRAARAAAGPRPAPLACDVRLHQGAERQRGFQLLHIAPGPARDPLPVRSEDGELGPGCPPRGTPSAPARRTSSHYIAVSYGDPTRRHGPCYLGWQNPAGGGCMRRTLVGLGVALVVVGCSSETAVPVAVLPAPTNFFYELEPSGDPAAPMGILLFWDHITSDALGAYRIYSRPDFNTDFGLRGETTSNTFHDNGPPHLEYFVVPVDFGGVEGVASPSVIMEEFLRLQSPAWLEGTSLDEAIYLVWSDNPFASEPNGFKQYRVYSADFSLDNPVCGAWGLEGTTIAPEFVVGALPNGQPRCFGISAESIEGWESLWSPIWADTPRPDSRNVMMAAIEADAALAGFRFWFDSNGDRLASRTELGLVLDGNRTDIDFRITRIGGRFYFRPVIATTAMLDMGFVEDLTVIDYAPKTGYARGDHEAVVGHGYVFEMDGGDGFARYGGIRVSHVGTDYVVFDWSFQTDPGNPELAIGGGLKPVGLKGVVIAH
jgi:sec-independent protein translocase protein TatC